jgi:hypothetical protein
VVDAAGCASGVRSLGALFVIFVVDVDGDDDEAAGGEALEAGRGGERIRAVTSESGGSAVVVVVVVAVGVVDGRVEAITCIQILGGEEKEREERLFLCALLGEDKTRERRS